MTREAWARTDFASIADLERDRDERRVENHELRAMLQRLADEAQRAAGAKDRKLAAVASSAQALLARRSA